MVALAVLLFVLPIGLVVAQELPQKELGSSAQQHTETSKGWQNVVLKVQAARDYSFIFDYSGERGFYKLLYSVVSPQTRIRSEILPGSDRGVGVVVVYDSTSSTELVTVDMGFLRVRRSLSSPDLKDTSFNVPLLQQLLSRTARSVLKSHQSLSYHDKPAARYTFLESTPDGELQHKVVVDLSSDVQSYEQLKNGERVELIEFSDIRWNCDPQIGF